MADMATNQRYAEADQVVLPVASGIVSGNPVRVGAAAGALVGVALTDRDASGKATVALKGAYDLPISTTTTLAEGAPVYITGAGVLTPVSTGNFLFGHALAAKGATANEIIPVKIAAYSGAASA